MQKFSFKVLFINVIAVGLMLLAVRPVMAQEAPAPIYDFNYHLVAIDAQTKGKITLDTKQVELGVVIENKS